MSVSTLVNPVSPSPVFTAAPGGPPIKPKRSRTLRNHKVDEWRRALALPGRMMPKQPDCVKRIGHGG
jgi:hypothetical protein